MAEAMTTPKNSKAQVLLNDRFVLLALPLAAILLVHPIINVRCQWSLQPQYADAGHGRYFWRFYSWCWVYTKILVMEMVI